MLYIITNKSTETVYTVASDKATKALELLRQRGSINTGDQVQVKTDNTAKVVTTKRHGHPSRAVV